MECIIIDDEKMARVITRTLSEEISELKVVDEFSNAIQAIKFLNENQIDLIFLDLHMPDFNGLDFMKTLKNPPKIILTTSDPNFAIEAFEYDFIIDCCAEAAVEASKLESERVFFTNLVGTFNILEKAKKTGGKIEIEVESQKDAILCAKLGADIIMLDNFSPDRIKKTIKREMW